MDPQKQLRRWPDVLRDLPADGFSTTPRESRALWLTVVSPTEAAPGTYSGTLTVTDASGDKATLPLEVVVHNLLLPDPSQWEFRVDFWQAMGRLSKAYNVPDWSDEWWGIVKTFLQDLAAHGESVVQVGRGHFDWRLTADGQWQFNFDRFDRYVELCDSVGIRGLIEYLQMFDGRGDTRIAYTDATGKAQQLTANPGDEQFDTLWTAFGRALAAHCREKGWLSRLYICPTDEPQDSYGHPTLDRFHKARQVLRNADPALRTTCALDNLKSARALAVDIDRFVFKLRDDVYDPAFAQELREQGRLVETYICCHPDRPNSFITSEAIEQRAIGWICWREQFQGLLRWSYLNWPADVWNKPEGDGKYAPGDLFIVYPGDRKPIASPRWERMREGFEDYEMLRALDRKITRSRSENKSAARALYNKTITEISGPAGKLTEYNRDPNAVQTLRRTLLESASSL
ncbi:MAG: glycoside hydrolase domain-containing protein [Armatimonadia bacterium]